MLDYTPNNSQAHFTPLGQAFLIKVSKDVLKALNYCLLKLNIFEILILELSTNSVFSPFALSIMSPIVTLKHWYK